MREFLTKNYWQIIVVTAFVLLFSLRIINLGYSDYNTDEATVVGRMAREEKDFSINYLLAQRKGPLQWLVAFVPFLIIGKITPEFWFRLPFALFNTAALYFLYKFLVLETKNRKLALSAAFLVGVNGFIVAFGRFLQYQSLNLFFSSLSLYFYARFLHEDDEKSVYFGSVAFAFSLLSHWDAVFILPYLAYVMVKKFRIKTLVFNTLLVLVLVAPFVLPFAQKLSANTDDQAYFLARLGTKNTFIHSEIRFRTLIYNPFFYLPFVTSLLVVAAVYIKKYLSLWIWFLPTLLTFGLLVKKPGTHVYNLIVPLSILAIAGYYEVSKFFKNEYKLIPIGILLAALSLLYYQSYILFVDHTKEYPWQQEDIFRYETTNFKHGDLTNHLIGFSHGRNWAETQTFVENYLEDKEDVDNYTYITNENKTISGLYLDLPYGESESFLALGVKDPYSFVSDYQFSQLSDKQTIHKIEDSQGNTLIVIYEVIKEPTHAPETN